MLLAADAVLEFQRPFQWPPVELWESERHLGPTFRAFVPGESVDSRSVQDARSQEKYEQNSWRLKIQCEEGHVYKKEVRPSQSTKINSPLMVI
jgi:hypothetical protein